MKKVFLLVTLMLIFPINVLGLNIEPKITCDKQVLKINESANCEFKLKVTNGNISGISAAYSYDSNNFNISFSKIGNWQGDASNGRLDFYDYKDYSGDISIANFVYKPNSNISSSIESSVTITVKEVSENSKSHELNSRVSVSFKVEKANNVTTTKQNTTVVSTTKNTTTTQSNEITKKNSTTKTITQTTTKIVEVPNNNENIINTSKVDNKTTTKKLTNENQKVNNKNEQKILLYLIPIIVLSFLMGVLSVIIIIVIKKKK